MIVLRAAVAASLLGVALSAQARVWVVDAANGAGADFTDIPPAIAAASDGDVVRIRAGAYSPFGVSKALRLIGGPSVSVVTAVASQPAISIAGLAPGKTLSLRGILALRQGAPALQTLRVVGNLGIVALEDVTVANATGPGIAFISSSNVVFLQGFGARGGARPDALLVFRCSFLSIQRSSLAGASALAPLAYASPALDCTDSTVEIVDSVLRGGDGDAVSASPPPAFGPAPAIMAPNCTLAIRGTGAHALSSGTGWLARYPTPVPAVRYGLIEIDAAIPLATHAGAPPFASPQKVTIWPLAALAAPATSLGGTLSISLRSPPSDPFALALSEPSPAFTSLGISLLDPARLVPLAAGGQGASGVTIVTVPVPANPALRGLVVAVQAGNAYLGTGRTALTNAVVTTLDG